MPNFSPMTSGPTRRTDPWGSGQYGAGRGQRTHQGLDIVARPGEAIRCPIEGDVVREAHPYPNEPRFSGVVIRGKGVWSGYEVKVFYVNGVFSGDAKPGQVLGHAQDLSGRYPGITNHVHVEVRQHGRALSPNDLFRMCF